MSESKPTYRGSVFYGRGPIALFRHWRFNRRLERILNDVPEGFRTVFTGNVLVQETVYAPGEAFLLTKIDQEEFHDACGCEKCHPEIHNGL